MNVYTLGMGSDLRTVEAPSAEAAVFFYFYYCVNANLPLVAVYTVNGQPFTGQSWWLEYCLGKPVDADFERRMTSIAPELNSCRVVKDGETEIAFDVLADDFSI